MAIQLVFMLYRFYLPMQANCTNNTRKINRKLHIINAFIWNGDDNDNASQYHWFSFVKSHRIDWYISDWNKEWNSFIKMTRNESTNGIEFGGIVLLLQTYVILCVCIDVCWRNHSFSLWFAARQLFTFCLLFASFHFKLKLLERPSNTWLCNHVWKPNK